jgi:hypothetical protein
MGGILRSETSNPVLTNRAALSTLVVLELRGQYYVLYDNRFGQRKRALGLPPTIELYPDEVCESPIPPTATMRFKATDVIVQDEANQAASPSAVSNEERKMTKRLVHVLIEATNSEVPVYGAMKEGLLAEQFATILHHIEDCGKLNDLTSRVSKAMTLGLSKDINDLLQIFKNIVDDKEMALGACGQESAKRNIQKLNNKQKELAIGAIERAPVVLACKHKMHPLEARQRAEMKKSGMPKGPIQLFCPTDQCGYVLTDRELANLLGDYYPTFLKDYRAYPTPTDPNFLFCMLCGKQLKKQRLITVHITHHFCLDCLRKYICSNNPTKGELMINPATLTAPGGPKLMMLKCPLRSCSFMFDESVTLQAFQPAEFFSVFEDALIKSNVDDWKVKLEIKKKALEESSSKFAAMSVYTGKSGVMPSATFACPIDKMQHPASEKICLDACEHSFCKDCLSK